MRAGVIVAVVGAFSLACGGGEGAAADAATAAPAAEAAPAAPASKYNDPSFQTYKYNRTTIKFNTDAKASTWWANMSCSTVEGTWSRDGDVITITWNDVENCMTWDEAKLKQVSDCSMAQYWMKDPTTGEVKDNDSWMYERTEPKCEK
jgi:hypothetical protein